HNDLDDLRAQLTQARADGARHLQVFDFPYRFNPAILPVGIAAGMLCAFAGGWLGLREVLRRPAMATLRDA
ncbi:hypothetical protein, partial [Ralstonia pseudosolanacearum]|uniref:hypothetical protein n=1 Tax=Ralstonia pseudosolanacearum TaxID=1310165 RepID=UPI003D165AB6